MLKMGRKMVKPNPSVTEEDDEEENRGLSDFPRIRTLSLSLIYLVSMCTALRECVG